MKQQGRSTRKYTGRRYRPYRGKRKHELGSEESEIHIEPTKKKTIRTRGGHQKQRLLRTNTANVTNPKTGKTQTTQMTTVTENTANQHYIRRNIITKGAIIQTELGPAKVTSRPGQGGAVNAVLIEG